MSEERPNWLLKISLVVVALGGLGWAIWRYSNVEPEKVIENEPPPADAKTKGPPTPPSLPPIPPGKGPKGPPSTPKG